MAKLRLGALEAGGTKMVCAIGDENGTIYEQVSIPTTTPKETIPKMIAYFRDKGIDALGIACFGPIELDRFRKIRLYHNHAKAGLEGLRYCGADAGGTSLPRGI